MPFFRYASWAKSNQESDATHDGSHPFLSGPLDTDRYLLPGEVFVICDGTSGKDLPIGTRCNQNSKLMGRLSSSKSSYIRKACLSKTNNAYAKNTTIDCVVIEKRGQVCGSKLPASKNTILKRKSGIYKGKLHLCLLICLLKHWQHWNGGIIGVSKRPGLACQ